MYDIEHYVTPQGKDIYLDWLSNLRDPRARLAVMRRIARMVEGNFGDHKFCRGGVWEARIDVGAGYRVYYGLSSKLVVLILCGGEKASQSSDIERACVLWKQYERERQDAHKKPR